MELNKLYYYYKKEENNGGNVKYTLHYIFDKDFKNNDYSSHTIQLTFVPNDCLLNNKDIEELVLIENTGYMSSKFKKII